jgi:osmotically-inducible protein OsmY
MATLTGHVSHYTEEMAAERAARRVKGVHAIAEGIEVRCLGETSDEEIARRSPNILKWYAMVPQDAVQVTVQKGRVTLTGDVIWAISAERPEDAVRKLSGVTGVTNSISIKSTADVSDIKKKIEDALTRHAQVEAQAIRVTVREGNKVSLEGRVVVGTNAKPSKSRPGRLPACSRSAPTFLQRPDVIDREVNSMSEFKQIFASFRSSWPRDVRSLSNSATQSMSP